MSDKARILLIAYKFPPYSQVGAFRWTYFAKYLADIGHAVDVVTVNWKRQAPGNLLDEVTHPGIAIHRIRSGYLHNLKIWRSGNRWIDGIKNRLFSRIIDRFFYWDDEAQYWGRYLLPKCEQLINGEGIGVVIATGSPFQSNVWAAELKCRNLDIRLIQDLRDPWARNPKKYYRDKEMALIMERNTLSVADHLVVVSKGMAEHFRQNLSSDVPVTVINNGFDPAMLPLKKSSDSTVKSGRIVYAGSLSNGREEILRQFLDALEKLQVENIQIIVVGNFPHALIEHYNSLIERGQLYFEGWVSRKRALSLIVGADYALQLNAEIYPYALSTKIFEYAAMRVPTLSLNYGGDIDVVVRNYSMGYSINLKHADLHGWIRRLADGELNEKFTFSVDDFAYDVLAEKYSDLIQTLTSQ